ncbi:MAG: hypothetical protein ACRC0X_08000 [Brevinema sp.]
MKKILLLLLIFVSCSIQNQDTDSIQNQYTENINQNPQIQEQYKQAWLALTKDITESSPYTGKADIWGGGAMQLDFVFDEKGNLLNNFDWEPDKYYELHSLISQESKFINSSFLDERTAIVFMPDSATSSPIMAGSVYVLRLSNETLYRTKSAYGFDHIETWDGIAVDTKDLVAIGTLKQVQNTGINPDPQIQAQYKKAWLALTKDITKDSPYTGKADIWGGGAMQLDFVFDEKGNLQNTDFWNINTLYPLHNLVSKHEKFSAFLDEKTAIVCIPSSASVKLAGTLYVLRLSNETLYRTKSAYGFDHIETWDGVSVDTKNLVAIGTPKK